MTDDNWYREMAVELGARDRALAAIEKWDKALKLALDNIEGLRVTKLAEEAEPETEHTEGVTTDAS